MSLLSNVVLLVELSGDLKLDVVLLAGAEDVGQGAGLGLLLAGKKGSLPSLLLKALLLQEKSLLSLLLKESRLSLLFKKGSLPSLLLSSGGRGGSSSGLLGLESVGNESHDLWSEGGEDLADDGGGLAGGDTSLLRLVLGLQGGGDRAGDLGSQAGNDLGDQGGGLLGGHGGAEGGGLGAELRLDSGGDGGLESSDDLLCQLGLLGAARAGAGA